MENNTNNLEKGRDQSGLETKPQSLPETKLTFEGREFQITDENSREELIDELKRKGSIYKLRNILETWESWSPGSCFEEGNTIEQNEKKEEELLNRQHKALEWISNNWIEENEIIEDAWDYLNNQPNSAEYSFLGIKLVQMIDWDYFKDNWENFFSFDEGIGDWMNSQLFIRDYKEKADPNEEWSVKVIYDLREHLKIKFALEVAELVERKAQEMTDVLDRKLKQRIITIDKYNEPFRHRGHFEVSHQKARDIEHICPDFRFGSECKSFKIWLRWEDYLLERIKERHALGHLQDYDPKSDDSQREFIDKFSNNREWFNDWFLGSKESLESRETNFKYGRDDRK